jgi:hypothetical protein
MIISTDIWIPFPRSLVYATYRDKLLDLVPYMPNVQRIAVQSRSEQSGLIHLVNEWQGGGEIPVAARMFLNENLLSWTDYTTWNDAEFTADWRNQTHAFTEAVHCAGKNRFLEKGGKTLVETRGELIIDPQKLKHVPHFLTHQIAHLIEGVLSKTIAPNLQHMGEGVSRYLQDHR